MEYAILLDFGSTHTKIVVVSLKEEKVLHTACFSSTVKTDARIGLELCFKEAKQILGEEAFHNAIKLSSSSAAGGLRMAVIGISKTLSITAGRNTAFGAGGKILATLSGCIEEQEVEKLIEEHVEIILFCGGYENGNRSIILNNARMLANSKIAVPIIYAGNSVIAKEVRTILTLGGKECFVADNIIPNVGILNTEKAESIVRNVFMKRIVNMKGLDKVKEQLDGLLMPTPSAVLSAGELLSRGVADVEGLGDLMIVDIGGATTDIHSYGEPSSYRGTRLVGAKEKYAKRTVESDLGVRESSSLLQNEIGALEIANIVGISQKSMEEAIQRRVNINKYIPHTDTEKKIDQALACGAAKISSRRHAGYVEHVHASNCKLLQRGKNLTNINCVIGTGGPIIHSQRPKQILQSILRSEEREPDILLPIKAHCFLDTNYILYAMGLLQEINPRIALKIMKENLVELK